MTLRAMKLDEMTEKENTELHEENPSLTKGQEKEEE